MRLRIAVVKFVNRLEVPQDCVFARVQLPTVVALQFLSNMLTLVLFQVVLVSERLPAARLSAVMNCRCRWRSSILIYYAVLIEGWVCGEDLRYARRSRRAAAWGLRLLLPLRPRWSPPSRCHPARHCLQVRQVWSIAAADVRIAEVGVVWRRWEWRLVNYHHCRARPVDIKPRGGLWCSLREFGPGEWRVRLQLQLLGCWVVVATPGEIRRDSGGVAGHAGALCQILGAVELLHPRNAQVFERLGIGI